MKRGQQLPELLLPGIPSAPKGKRFITAAEIDYQKRKRRLAPRLPVLKPEDLIGTLEQPFYQTLLRDLMASGNSVVADEINNLLRKEERDRKAGRVKNRMTPVKLIEQPEVLRKIADTLRLEQTLLHEGKKESAMLICKQLADSFLLQDRSIWLARHFYLAVLYRCRKICPKSTDRLQAEIHCLLAYIARENNESLESALAIAIDHLAVCRTLSRDQNWQFKPNTILVKLKRPIAFYGITTDGRLKLTNDVYEVVDACTMSIYMIASLLEHELLISLANQIMHSSHHKAPSDEDLKNAHEFADLALQLALEVRQPVALSSALTRFGIVLRHVGAYEDAMRYFQQLQQHANFIADPATEAIAYHNMGLCYIGWVWAGMMNAVEALECFAQQKELASIVLVRELEGNSMQEIGHVLLQEGHLWEAEEAYAKAYEDFHYAEAARKLISDDRKSVDASSNQHPNHESMNRCEVSWAMFGVAAGHKLWSRHAGLCRSGKSPDLRSVLQFKCGRKPLNPVGRPDYNFEEISEMKRPWEPDSLKEVAPTLAEAEVSESSWEDGFMFSKANEDSKKKKKKAVGFDSNVLDNALSQAMDIRESLAIMQSGPLSRKSQHDALKGLLEVKKELDAEKTNLFSQRVSQVLEKDRAMRMSLHSALSARGSTVSATLMDKRPTLGSLAAVAKAVASFSSMAGKSKSVVSN
ncbi:hypothetical protein Ocin01_07874 [Orchesella cincta]|uniref:Tetratricopeptide repeat protein 29 n=1 Tax=Orchesella cincta TaxID=48709 RepID=A0A1D2N0G8_ORCCI|nr:hypothetical protein Ocin01_07874 [Orchesella cincta]